MRFDVSTLAPGMVVDSASLALWVIEGGSNGNSLKLDAYRLLRPWRQGQVTWNLPWDAPAASTLLTPADVGHWISLDLTTLVQDWINAPGTNWGLILRAATDVNFPNGGATDYN